MGKNVFLKYSLTAIVGLFLFFFFFKFVLRLILPFLIAFVLALLIRPPVNILSKRLGTGKRLLSAVFVALSVLLFGFITFLITNRLITEIGRFAASASENSGSFVNSFFSFLDDIADKIPFIEAVGGDLTESVSDALNSMLTAMTARLPQILAYVIGSLPEILLFTVIIIMASYYFCADYEKNTETASKILPSGVMRFLSDFKRRLTDTGIKYLRACLFLLIITYAELIVGFLMLKIPYAFTLALIIAAVDMLPILGVGTVLIPWALWEWITGNTYLAVGLIIVNLTVTVVRRFIEPRVIGSGIGLSPLVTLFAMYVGFRLFGFTGLFFSPLITILIIHSLPDNLASKFGIKRKNQVNKE